MCSNFFPDSEELGGRKECSGSMPGTPFMTNVKLADDQLVFEGFSIRKTLPFLAACCAVSATAKETVASIEWGLWFTSEENGYSSAVGPANFKNTRKADNRDSGEIAIEAPGKLEFTYQFWDDRKKNVIKFSPENHGGMPRPSEQGSFHLSRQRRGRFQHQEGRLSGEVRSQTELQNERFPLNPANPAAGSQNSKRKGCSLTSLSA